jgi:hypothetical protein
MQGGPPALTGFPTLARQGVQRQIEGAGEELPAALAEQCEPVAVQQFEKALGRLAEAQVAGGEV